MLIHCCLDNLFVEFFDVHTVEISVNGIGQVERLQICDTVALVRLLGEFLDVLFVENNVWVDFLYVDNSSGCAVDVCNTVREVGVAFYNTLFFEGLPSSEGLLDAQS